MGMENAVGRTGMEESDGWGAITTGEDDDEFEI